MSSFLYDTNLIIHCDFFDQSSINAYKLDQSKELY